MTTKSGLAFACKIGCIAALMTGRLTPVQADILVRIPSQEVVIGASSPEDRVIEVGLAVDGDDLGRLVSGWNLTLEIASFSGDVQAESIAFGSPVDPDSNDLFPDAPVHPVTFGDASAASAVAFPGNGLFDGAKLLAIPFDISGTHLGSFTLEFDEDMSMLFGSSGDAVPVSFEGGTVRLVPEPNSLLLVVLGGLFALRRRHFFSTHSRRNGRSFGFAKVVC